MNNLEKKGVWSTALELELEFLLVQLWKSKQSKFGFELNLFFENITMFSSHSLDNYLIHIPLYGKNVHDMNKLKK